MNSQAGAQEAVIVIKNLCKSFGTNQVLDHFDLSLFRGENLVVLGKSGSGKSVLIKCIIGLIKPDQGSIAVLGQNVLELDRLALDEIRVKVGFLFQSNALYDSMTVRENLEFPLRRHTIQLTQQEANDLVMEALRNVGLERTVDMMPSNFPAACANASLWPAPSSSNLKLSFTMNPPQAWTPSPASKSSH